MLAALVLPMLLVALAPASRAAGTNAVETLKPVPYPLKTCLVAEDKLGGMGPPFSFVYKGQEIKLCCSGCKEDFDKDPEKYIKKMKEAEAKAKSADTKK